MIWKQYHRAHGAVVPATAGTNRHAAEMEIGSVHTGKSKTPAGYYCRIICAEHDLNVESSTMLGAVITAIEQLNKRGVSVTVCAVDPHFTESGLSFNSGWGYLDGTGDPVMMLDAPVSGKGSPTITLLKGQQNAAHTGTY